MHDGGQQQRAPADRAHHNSAELPVGLAPARGRYLAADHERVDVILPGPAVSPEDLADVLVVKRPARREGPRVGVLGARVRIVREIRTLHLRLGPHLRAQTEPVGMAVDGGARGGLIWNAARAFELRKSRSPM